MTEETFEPARRELCPDETCVGLIGSDGRCKVCGSVGASAIADPRNQGMAQGDDADADPLDDDRELCPDGACIGVIGDDGLCKVCGKQGTAPAAPHAARPAAAKLAPAPAAAESLEVDDDEDRELCADGSCIGLIGSDGRCKVCGLSRASASP